MRTPLHPLLGLLMLVFGLALAFSGCKSPEDKAADRLVGTWEADMSSVTIEGADDEELEMIRVLLADDVMRLTFNDDGTSMKHTEHDGEIADEPGTWQVLSVDGESLVLQRIEENEDDENDAPRTITFVDDSTFDMTGDENGSEVSLRFNRVE